MGLLLILEVERGRVDFLEGVSRADVPSRADDAFAINEPARDVNVLQTGTLANRVSLAVLVAGGQVPAAAPSRAPRPGEADEHDETGE